ncbi:MAG: sodium:proton antiporter [Patescibacteria group bacterium]|nr:sodium:proton antiporter [Patescibacteria group bacterium]
MEHTITITSLFIAFFLLVISFSYQLTSRLSFMPYTVLLLVIGLIAQYISKTFGFDIHLNVSHEFIYYFLLPLLLFESAFHINLHQFKLQFKTISFLATFGLSVSIFIVSVILATFLGLKWEDALLFGAIISATDPIAVISMFKSLGAPRRLALIADGESMLNDATAVIAFRLISALVISENTSLTTNQTLISIGTFLYVFFGSIIFGVALGYIFTKIMQYLKNERVLVTSITVASALGSFVIAEFFFKLSGVISLVIFAIILGNFGKTKISANVKKFEEELWEFFAFVAVSIVFFFATFTIDLSIFAGNAYGIFIAIIATLFARAVSVYISCFITNRFKFFSDEPNIPISWQHILNWGGLRGVIPLVLVYSLPKNYPMYDTMLTFTLGVFLFTLFVNGLTIRSLLLSLGLHLPKKEEEILLEEKRIYDLEEAKSVIRNIYKDEVEKSILDEIECKLSDEQKEHKKHLFKLSKGKTIARCLQIQSLEIERNCLDKLFEEGYISENVYYDFDVELDMQEDALEYPEVSQGRAYQMGGLIPSATSFKNQIEKLKTLMSKLPFAKNVFKRSEEEIIKERISLLKARIITSKEVINYFKKLLDLLKDNNIVKKEIRKIISTQSKLILKNENYLEEIIRENPKVYSSYQKKVAYALITNKKET